MIARRRLPRYTQAVIRGGRTHHYFRKPGCPRAKLPGLPWSESFMRVYAACMAGEPLPEVSALETTARPDSVRSAVDGYLNSGDFARLAKRTQADRRSLLERFAKEHGTKSVSTFAKRHIELWVSAKSVKTPAAARKLLVAFRALMDYAVRLGLRGDDPTIGIKRPRIRSDGYRTWSASRSSRRGIRLG
jgi:hypothetical protein